MTEAMPFLRKIILLSYDPRPFLRCVLFVSGLFHYRYRFIRSAS